MKSQGKWIYTPLRKGMITWLYNQTTESGIPESGSLATQKEYLNPIFISKYVLTLLMGA